MRERFETKSKSNLLKEIEDILADATQSELSSIKECIMNRNSMRTEKTQMEELGSTQSNVSTTMLPRKKQTTVLQTRKPVSGPRTAPSAYLVTIGLRPLQPVKNNNCHRHPGDTQESTRANDKINTGSKGNANNCHMHRARTTL